MQSKPNRLIREKSPYLLQHAHNPVEWYPWGEEAFEKARKEDRPIFLSIGYATCHWCHVMERESFENEEVAARLNEAFVCIKVDREERPDIDEIYMAACQMLTGSGGWPLSIVMTPDMQPFFAATYIPRESRFGRSGLLELIPSLAAAWETRREEILNSAGKIAAALSARSPMPGALDNDVFDRAFQDAAESFDSEYGGFGSAPKFPMAHRLNFLIRQDPDGARDMVTATLEALRAGGIWDHVGSGIHRYSTDREWLVPHFEKMLYDQALLALACIEAFEAYGDQTARRMAEEIFDYVRRDMTDSGGAFYSAEDADSEGVEGRFYVWSLDELRDVLGETDAATAAELFNAQPGGNFRDEATGRRTGENILHLSSLAEVPPGLRARLFAAREKRVHPLKDMKILADWNGLMIAALAKAARVFDLPECEAAARRAAEFILSEMSDGDRLWHRWCDGEAAVSGQLDDYAFMIFGLLELYETSFDIRLLEKALALNETVLSHFHDKLDGGFFLTSDDAEQLIRRPKNMHDSALPSGNSVQMMNLLRLSRLTGRTRYEALADQTAAAFADRINRFPGGFSQALQAVLFARSPAVEVVVCGDQSAPETRALIDAVRSVYLPNRTVLLKEPDDQAVEELIPFTAGMQPVSGQPAVYICRNFSCEQPLTDPGAVRRTLLQ